VLEPEDVFSYASVFELPNIEQDHAFFAQSWREHPLHASYLLRYLTGRFPVWPPADSPATVSLIAALSARLIERFVTRAEEEGIEPFVAYLPTTGDLRGGDRALNRALFAELARLDVEARDLTDCFRTEGAVDASDAHLFTRAAHYSAAGNRAMAKCISP
jgi:hypothetical protein